MPGIFVLLTRITQANNIFHTLIIALMNYFKSFDSELIAFETHQEPNDPTDHLIFVHGLGGDVSFLLPTIVPLSQLQPDVAIYSIWLRGHAFSSKKFPPGRHTIETVHALDLQALIKHLKIERPILLGHSLGGQIIQAYVSQKLSPAPKKFFLVCSSLKNGGNQRLRHLAYKILTKLPAPRTKFSSRPPDFYQSFAHSSDLNIFRFWYDSGVLGGLTYWLLHFFSILGWENNDRKSLDQNSGFYLYGKKDIIIPRGHQIRHLKKFKNLHKIEIDSGHIAPITAGEDLAKTISQNL